MAARTWLAVVLSCLVWFVYMRWFAPMPPAPTPAQVAVEAVNPGASQSTPTLSAGSGIPVAGSVPTTPFAARPVLAESEKLASAAREVVLSDAGGKISEVRLLDYAESLKADAPKILSISPLKMPLSMATLFTEPKLAELGFGEYSKRVVDGKVVFQKTTDGVTVTKTYSPTEGDYFLNLDVRVQFAPGMKNPGALLIPLGGFDLKYNAEDPLQAWEAISYQNESIKRHTIDSIESGSAPLQGTTQWIAFGNRYFSSAVINESTINPDVVFEKSGDFTGVFLKYPLASKDLNDVVLKLRLFSGPKEVSELARVAGMRQLIDYGMFSFFAYPLLELLRFFYRFTHNYGWAIILLTILVRLLFYPLSLKSFRSMKQMQKLQPHIAALKEKHKADQQAFGQAQMALFREHKVNPAGGCLPMLVQLPVFIALYAVLQNSIELFHAPFFGWIQDLSSKDPYYIFPVLMGIAMFVQQKMTPAAGMDPMQQKILLLMPVIFTFIMASLPSGLTIYIFVSTLLGILQQVMMNREQGPNEKLVAAPTQGK